MPRVANQQPTGKSQTTASKQTLATPHKSSSSPVKLCLNDDRPEKAARLQSRQALHDVQMNQIKAAAASPMRKMNAHDNHSNKRPASSSPRTPRSAAANARDGDRGKENNDPHGSSPGLLNVVSHSAVTPMKRVPILANFEEWMKMATDNKINATNSWNFALIDYFHDMSLLKEGDGVNFQKASCTLDGCVKIYTSRVDSVASETGKLLSGLADSGGGKKAKDKGEEGGEGESGDEEDDGEDGGRKKAKKKTQRSHEQTLAPSFASLQLKKLELEFAVDPLFKKASADFDEGGAKGLLLNHLSINSEGRIVFDSSDDTADVKSYPNSNQMQQTLVDPTASLAEDVSNLSLLPDNQPAPDQEIDLSSLALKFFPDLSILDSQDICPSMKSFTLGDPTSDLNLPFLKAPNDWRGESHKANDQDTDTDPPLIKIPIGDKSGIFLDSENAAGFDDDDDDGIGGPIGGFDLGPDVGFGEGGEAWAKDAALEPMLRAVRVDENDPCGSTDREEGGGDGSGIVTGDFDPSNPNSDAYTIGLNNYHNQHHNDTAENILSYFDAALRSTKAASWAGPEHWRIRKLKTAQSQSQQQQQQQQQQPSSSSNNPPAPGVRTRKEKEAFQLDFLAPMDQTLADLLYTPAASNAAISLPKAQWKVGGRNLLPDDRHFNSRGLLGLWIKPKASLGGRRMGRRRREGVLAGRGGEVGEEAMEGNLEMDEGYWARRRAEEEESERQRREDGDGDGERKEGDYDADFFADDGVALPFGAGAGLSDDDDDDGGPGFTDAREMLSPPPTAAAGMALDSQAPGLDGLASQPAAAAAAAAATTVESHLLPGSFGSQLVTQAGRKLRPEYVNYARVAKKVDVRRLKENMWRGMSGRLISSLEGFPGEAPAPAAAGAAAAAAAEEEEESGDAPPTPAPTDPGLDADLASEPGMVDVDVVVAAAASAVKEQQQVGGNGEGKELKFTAMIRDLRRVYPEQQMRDISTSYCFICLLHLANEKGLVLEGDYPIDVAAGGEGRREGGGGGGGGGEKGFGTGLMREIRVRRDESVGVGYVGE